jgi:hypothetical protein
MNLAESALTPDIRPLFRVESLMPTQCGRIREEHDEKAAIYSRGRSGDAYSIRRSGFRRRDNRQRKDPRAIARKLDLRLLRAER